jgi:hypothetical protein
VSALPALQSLRKRVEELRIAHDLPADSAQFKMQAERNAGWNIAVKAVLREIDRVAAEALRAESFSDLGAVCPTPPVFADPPLDFRQYMGTAPLGGRAGSEDEERERRRQVGFPPLFSAAHVRRRRLRETALLLLKAAAEGSANPLPEGVVRECVRLARIFEAEVAEVANPEAEVATT